MRSILFVLAISLAVTPHCPPFVRGDEGGSAGNWPGWRGPGARGVSTETNLPVKWSDVDNVRWKVPIPGEGVGTPVVWGERVFLTASDGRLDDHLHVYCLHRDDGRTLWHTKLFGSGLPEWYFPAGGMAIPTPTTDGKHLYALFGTGDLVCLDFDGKPVWMRSLAQEFGVFRNRWGMAASPLLVDLPPSVPPYEGGMKGGRLLVIQVDQWGKPYLMAVDPATGATRWRTERDAAVNWTSPVAVRVGKKTQIVVSGTYKVQGYDAATGKELWTVDGLRQQCIPTPAVNGNFVYAVSGPKGTTFAIRVDGKRGNVTESNVIWKSRRGAANIPSPVAYGDSLYLIDDAGFATCLDAKSGDEIWRARIGGKHQASVLVGDRKLYYTSLDGTVTVARAGRKFEILSKNRMGEAIVATPAIAASRIYLRGRKHLFCIEEKK